eukprot:449421_1
MAAFVESNFDIFESNEIKCKSEIEIISQCSALYRVFVALKHYDELCNDNNNSPVNQQLFVKFCLEQYHNFINDYIHIIKCHGNDLEEINNELIHKYGVKKCNISNCKKVVRHYRREREEEKKESITHDIKYSFYSDYYDNLHFFIFHLFDASLRTKRANKTSDTNNKDNIQNFVSTDMAFAQKKDKMNATKNQLGVDTDTLNNDINSKFNIHVMSSDSDKTDVTFTDRLYEHIINGKIIQQNEFIPIKQFIDKNEYETDSITDDIIDENESNIGYYFGDKIVKVFKNYHKDYHRYDKLSSASFSLGLEWNYWDISDALFVPKCYASLKEEILESTFLTIQQWNENVAMKADELMKAHETKKK